MEEVKLKIKMFLAKFLKPWIQWKFRKKTNLMLDLGAGKHPHYLCMSCDMSIGANIFVDVSDFPLPFKSGSVDFIYSSHLFEHLSRNEIKMLLKECFRILSENGKMRLVVPDFDKFYEMYATAEFNSKMDKSLIDVSQPISMIEYVVYNRGHKSIHTIKSIEILASMLGYGSSRSEYEPGNDPVDRMWESIYINLEKVKKNG